MNFTCRNHYYRTKRRMVQFSLEPEEGAQPNHRSRTVGYYFIRLRTGIASVGYKNNIPSQEPIKYQSTKV